MKLSLLAVCAAFVTSADALSPPITVGGRRAFLAKVVTSTATAAVTIAAVSSPAAAAPEQYSLDLDESFKKEAPEKKSGNGGTIVGAALGGGLLLSLPFFAPNLARLAGVKNAKIKDKK
jgi:hypothetical protein